MWGLLQGAFAAGRERRPVGFCCQGAGRVLGWEMKKRKHQEKWGFLLKSGPGVADRAWRGGGEGGGLEEEPDHLWGLGE